MLHEQLNLQLIMQRKGRMYLLERFWTAEVLRAPEAPVVAAAGGEMLIESVQVGETPTAAVAVRLLVRIVLLIVLITSTSPAI